MEAPSKRNAMPPSLSSPSLLPPQVHHFPTVDFLTLDVAKENFACLSSSNLLFVAGNKAHRMPPTPMLLKARVPILFAFRLPWYRHSTPAAARGSRTHSVSAVNNRIYLVSREERHMLKQRMLLALWFFISLSAARPSLYPSAHVLPPLSFVPHNTFLGSSGSSKAAFP